jgi:hypothetical protein
MNVPTPLLLSVSSPEQEAKMLKGSFVYFCLVATAITYLTGGSNKDAMHS